MLYRILNEPNYWQVNSKRCLLHRILSESNHREVNSKKCLLYRILSECYYWQADSKRCLLYRILNESIIEKWIARDVCCIGFWMNLLTSTIELIVFCTPLLLVTLDFCLSGFNTENGFLLYNPHCLPHFFIFYYCLWKLVQFLLSPIPTLPQ